MIVGRKALVLTPFVVIIVVVIFAAATQVGRAAGSWLVGEVRSNPVAVALALMCLSTGSLLAMSRVKRHPSGSGDV